MHLAAINVGDLLIPLWRGAHPTEGHDDSSSWDWAALSDSDLWRKLGALVASWATYLPISFDKTPRDLQKIHSHYRAWEWLILLYGYGPALFFGVLEERYWQHFCRLVRGIRILQQHSITADQLAEADKQLKLFAWEFETLYVQGQTNRIHFVRPWIHAITHLADETERKGPPITCSQWTLERMIGDLGREIRNHVSPYANLSIRATLRCQVNALKALYPETFDPEHPDLPRGCDDLGDGYLLLRRRDRYSRVVSPAEEVVLTDALLSLGYRFEDAPRVQRWARLQLPHGQVARSLWQEDSMTRGVRCSRNVSFQLPGDAAPSCGEVRYYFKMRHPSVKAFAMVSAYGLPDPDLRRRSFDTLHACKHGSDEDLCIIDVKNIRSVVAMIPHRFPDSRDLFFVVEKPGLSFTVLTGYEEPSHE
ncbi:hypothetical protein CONPUDRAFT_43905 [Coniophora puteana RWD-64-598 SS2]|uniref:Uncharacterized protein n=1 Tax=Coniophora puteana (strain RWD-64-598) TaxID=741705 RepID=A0A5M3N411_CONPW|nr:uncharacterized protein CONPUDRAFT_43905 [Coniophora puteana RWD-64-598 SS2]EIW85987.1 hypothetical protein CONPUDRAFT_43905 [Coniophora puteana RWD-64-598 SS2]